MANPLIKFVQSVCVQTAVYWACPVPDGFGGKSYSEPIEIKVRWDEKTQRITGRNGETIVSDAEILVTDDLDVGGMLYLGELNDLDSSHEDSPEDMDDAYRIEQIEKTPLFRSATEFVRTVYLTKKRG